MNSVPFSKMFCWIYFWRKIFQMVKQKWLYIRDRGNLCNYWFDSLIRPGANASHQNNFWLLFSRCHYLASVIVVLWLYQCWYLSWDCPHISFVFSLCSVFLMMVAIKSKRLLSLLNVSRTVQIILVFSILSSQKRLEDCHKVNYLLNVQTMKH